jgi:hypothetical protein
MMFLFRCFRVFRSIFGEYDDLAGKSSEETRSILRGMRIVAGLVGLPIGIIIGCFVI